MVISHRQHRGLGEALNTSVRTALELGIDALVTIDADGQFDAVQIPDLLKPLREEHADVVTSSRCLHGNRPAPMPRVRSWGNLFFSPLLNGLTGARLRNAPCDVPAYLRPRSTEHATRLLTAWGMPA